MEQKFTGTAAGLSAGCQIVVLGMHRSGTSAVTKVIAALGAEVGTDEELLEAAPDNPRGFFERHDVHQLCSALLRDAGADWWRISSFLPESIPESALTTHGEAFATILADLKNRNSVCVIKEPRMCLLLPVLSRFLSNPVTIVVTRNPVEVAQSLRQRNGFPRIVGLALWEAYMIAALNASSAMPRIFVNYHKLIANPGRVSEALRTRLGEFGARGLDGDPARVVSRRLRRHRASAEAMRDLASDFQRELWAQLSVGRAPESVPAEISPFARAILQDFEADELRQMQQARALDAAQGELHEALASLDKKSVA
jgi:hypothetical protein